MKSVSLHLSSILMFLPTMRHLLKAENFILLPNTQNWAIQMVKFKRDSEQTSHSQNRKYGQCSCRFCPAYANSTITIFYTVISRGRMCYVSQTHQTDNVQFTSQQISECLKSYILRQISRRHRSEHHTISAQKFGRTKSMTTRQIFSAWAYCCTN